MPTPATETGTDSTIVREYVQSQYDKLDQLLADPAWCADNNKSTPDEIANGGLTFQIEFDGTLNDAEIDAFGTWTGWDVATVINVPHNGLDSAFEPRFRVTLIKNPGV